jgi:hypothetical protein
MRVWNSRNFSRSASVALALAMIAAPGLGVSANAQSALSPEPVADGASGVDSRTTVVVFADRSMEDRHWTALFDALRANVAEAESESPALGGMPDLVRGDAMKPGLRVDTAIVVYLRVDCDLEPLSRRTAYNVPLGWARRVDGRIEIFVHVDCTRIGQVLGPRAQGLNRDQRDAMIAGAMARVILHEWVHIATENLVHAEQGLSKARFGVIDLLAGSGHPIARMRSLW